VVQGTATSDLIDIDELARRWDISKATVYRLLGDGLPSITIRGSRRFDPASCDGWLAAQQESAS
jgi:hypothetical protein